MELGLDVTENSGEAGGIDLKQLGALVPTSINFFSHYKDEHDSCEDLKYKLILSLNSIIRHFKRQFYFDIIDNIHAMDSQ